MTRVAFTTHLRQYVDGPLEVPGGSTLGEALAAAFVANPRLRGYILDDQGALRRYVAVFIDGIVARDREHLTDPVPADAEVFIMQSLAGG